MSTRSRSLGCFLCCAKILSLAFAACAFEVLVKEEKMSVFPYVLFQEFYSFRSDIQVFKLL